MVMRLVSRMLVIVGLLSRSLPPCRAGRFSEVVTILARREPLANARKPGALHVVFRD
jgi:hypothetical protein